MSDQTTPIISDSHCHLDFPDFDEDRDQIVARALDAGVKRMVSICTKMPNLSKVQQISETYDSVFFAAAVHPMSVASEPMIEVNDLISMARHPKCVAIGETGLDYHYTSESKDLQIESLKRHIDAARQVDLPLVIHSRDADDDMAQILTDAHKHAPFACIMHCFSSGKPLAEAALDLGFYLSMSGIAAFPRSQELRDIFKIAPVDRILVETDAPYVAPPPHRGKRNEPAFSVHTAKIGAEVFDLSYAAFAEQLEENFNRVFKKAAAWTPS